MVLPVGFPYIIGHLFLPDDVIFNPCHVIEKRTIYLDILRASLSFRNRTFLSLLLRRPLSHFSTSAIPLPFPPKRVSNFSRSQNLFLRRQTGTCPDGAGVHGDESLSVLSVFSSAVLCGVCLIGRSRGSNAGSCSISRYEITMPCSRLNSKWSPGGIDMFSSLWPVLASADL